MKHILLPAVLLTSAIPTMGAAALIQLDLNGVIDASSTLSYYPDGVYSWGDIYSRTPETSLLNAAITLSFIFDTDSPSYSDGTALTAGLPSILSVGVTLGTNSASSQTWTALSGEIEGSNGGSYFSNFLDISYAASVLGGDSVFSLWLGAVETDSRDIADLASGTGGDWYESWGSGQIQVLPASTAGLVQGDVVGSEMFFDIDEIRVGTVSPGVSVVPLPASALLLPTGLSALMLFRRRQKR